MVDDHISSREDSIKKSHFFLVHTPFDQFATDHGYDLTPPVALPKPQIQ